MIELSRHIESLMLKHDCVIVPGLGGFVTQYVSARRVDDEQLFLPPYRSVGFNPQLTLNDGLLVQSYMQAYDTTYPETVKLLDDAVAQLKKQLQQDGEYELRGIGTLSMDVSGKYDFVPCEAGVLSPELYGLDSVVVAPVTERSAASDADKTTASKQGKKKVNVKRTEREYTISINRELVNYVAAAIVAVVFYFLWATPVNNSANADHQTASVVYEQLFDKAAQKVASSTAVTPINNEAAQSQCAEATDSLQAQPQSVNAPLSISVPQEQPVGRNDVATPQQTENTEKDQAQAENSSQNVSPNAGYTLVLASAIGESSASAFAQNLKKEGYPDAKPYKRGKMVRVVYGHYNTENEAQQALSQLRRHKAFAEAWVMQTK